MKTFLILGSLSAFLAVALGAFAAHALKEKLPADMLAVFEVGVRYHLYHSLALFVVAWVGSQFPGSNMDAAGWLFVAGIILFSGSLYAMSVTGSRSLGIITPFGGLCFLGGWIWIAYGVWKSTMSS
ncbi:MAG TPA: DUF423 domain-containing protein [Bacteroidota bacterium]|jgi:uncharacterized membrane protein YgdD (TMEM256/DUF423 family)